MKKLYKKSTVHPSPPSPPPPPPPPQPPISDHLSLLPAAIFTLTLALSSQDKEVLAYLLSSSTTKKTTTTTTTTAGAGDHQPLFNCSCFRCYMSYWVRWDSSPNRQLIHEIIDALEDGLVRNKKEKSKKDRKKKVIISSSSSSSNNSNEEKALTESEELPLTQSAEVSHEKMESVVERDGEEEGPVRKLVSYIWSVWT